jgi:hypothetical protein
MAIRLQFINLAIPVATLDRLWASEDGFAGFLREQRVAVGDLIWHDAHLCRAEGAMDWSQVDEMVSRWEAKGLQGLVGTGAHRWWKDFAICASRRGATFPCEWLCYDALENAVYLTGTQMGAVEGPALLS